MRPKQGVAAMAVAAVLAVSSVAGCSSGPVDACGNDISGLRGTLFALDVTSGEVVWKAETPLVDPWVIERDGVVRLSRAYQGGDLYFDAATGRRVGEDDTRHTVMFFPSSGGSNQAGDLVVDDELVPNVVTFGATTIMRRLGGELAAFDTTTGSDVWTHPLPRPAGERPTLVGDHVVSVVTDSRPSCV